MNGKYIFKKALKQVLPASVLHRRKMGFGVPLAHWFRNDLKELASNVIFSRNQDVLLNESIVKRVWQEHQSGLRDRSTELWTVLMFRLWQRQFMALRSGNVESGANQIRSIACALHYSVAHRGRHADQGLRSDGYGKGNGVDDCRH